MEDTIKTLQELYAKAYNLSKEFKDLPAKDIRKVHLEILAGQIAVSMTNLTINEQFSVSNKTEFYQLFNNDKTQADNYIFQLTQNAVESIIDAAIFQTELLMRFYYSKLTGIPPGQERNINKIAATLFQDVENNWSKEEAKLIVVLWTFRNTIHTGGIYFSKQGGQSLVYKGKTYLFEIGKAPAFLKDGHSLEMISALLDSINYLFKSNLIKNMGSFEHPSYHALGY